MEVNVLENKKNYLVFELKGVDQTFCNAVKEELSMLADVDIATYSVSHPLVGVPKFHLRTKAKEPQKAISEAVKNLKAKNQEFLKAFKGLK